MRDEYCLQEQEQLEYYCWSAPDHGGTELSVAYV